MKITVGQLRAIIKEEAAAAATSIPVPEEDVYVFPEEPEYGGEEVGFQYISDSGDLKDFPDDLEWSPGSGPEPGSPGVWIVTDDGMSWTFGPGELVLAPEYNQGAARAWIRKSSLSKLKNLSTAAGSPEDQKILKMLGKVTTYGEMPLNGVKAFSIRLRKDSILFNYDPFGRGITGTILAKDLKGLKMTLPELADWMTEHGARKIKPQKRLRSTSYYD